MRRTERNRYCEERGNGMKPKMSDEMEKDLKLLAKLVSKNYFKEEKGDKK